MKHIYVNVLDENWIHGDSNLKRYTFHSCTIKRIESFYLPHGAYKSVSIEFFNSTIDFIGDNAFNKIHIEILFFDNCNVGHISKNILISSSSTLRQFRFLKIPNYLTLDHLFRAKLKYTNLHDIEVTSTTNHMAILSSSNFTSMPNIKGIYLALCRIRAIEWGTFDHIYSTLEELILSENLIKTLSPWIFNKILGRTNGLPIEIDLYENPISCDCNFHVLVTLGTRINVNHSMSIFRPQVKCIRENGNMNYSLVSECKELQIIHPLKICQSDREFDKVIYSKFTIRLNIEKESLMIMSVVNDSYRLWIYDYIDPNLYYKKWIYSDKKCPPNKTLEQATKCQIIRGHNAEIPIGNLLATSKLTIFCVSYIHGGYEIRFWPLHCISYGGAHSIDVVTLRDALSIWATISILSMFCGFLLSRFCYKFIIQKDLDVNNKMPFSHTLQNQ